MTQTEQRRRPGRSRLPQSRAVTECESLTLTFTGSANKGVGVICGSRSAQASDDGFVNERMIVQRSPRAEIPHRPFGGYARRPETKIAFLKPGRRLGS
jgi:hypothetical protein